MADLFVALLVSRAAYINPYASGLLVARLGAPTKWVAGHSERSYGASNLYSGAIR